MMKSTSTVLALLVLLNCQLVMAQNKPKKSRKNWSSHLIKAPVEQQQMTEYTGQKKQTVKKQSAKRAVKKVTTNVTQTAAIAKKKRQENRPVRFAKTTIKTPVKTVPKKSRKPATRPEFISRGLIRRIQAAQQGEPQEKQGSARQRILETIENEPKLDFPGQPQERGKIAKPIVRREKKVDERTFGPWPSKSIRDIKIDIRSGTAELPKDYSNQLVERQNAAWQNFAVTSKLFAWESPNIKYQPLYFEDVALERYGQTYRGLRQLTRSAVHFGLSSALLPYKMTVDPPRSCDFPLGFCRPGSCGPSIYQVHWLGF